MSSSQTQDRPGLSKKTFKAEVSINPQPLHLTVSGQVTGDYRVKSVKLVSDQRHTTSQKLAYQLVADLGPVENPHPEIIRVFDVEATESPYQGQYKEVEIIDGHERVTVKIVQI